MKQQQWFENDSIWRDLYDVMFPEDRFSSAYQEVEQICTLSCILSGEVLDMACGPGRHAVAFAERGFRVTGVDLSEFLLEKARVRAEDKGVSAEWVRSDMRTFARPESFALAISLYSSFGYFEHRDEDLQVFTNVYQSLKPNGVFVIDVRGKEITAREFQPVFAKRLEDGTILIQCLEITDDWSQVLNEWIVVRDQSANRYRLSVHIYSGQELKDRLKMAGFESVRLYGNLQASPYGWQAQRLVAVAIKKPDSQNQCGIQS